MSNNVNLILFGKSGNGKSATGNSILGRNAFSSMPSLCCVTSNCGLQTGMLKDGRVLNVIDTPELEAELIGKEIARCVNLVKNGIHAILVVFSVRSRLSPDVEVAIEKLKTIFGEKILNYMIIVFTGGDDLERFGLSFYEFISHKRHHSLQKFIQYCNGRIVLFDNGTRDNKKQAQQLDDLMYLVDFVITNNCPQPFSNNIFDKLKEGALMLKEKEQVVEPFDGFSKQEISPRIIHFVEHKLKQTVEKLEKRLAEKQAEVEHKLKQTVEELEKRVAEKQSELEQKLKQFVEKFEKRWAKQNLGLEALKILEEARIKMKEKNLGLEALKIHEEARIKMKEKVCSLSSVE